MSGDPCKDKIEAYVLGLLDEVEARRVEQHLQSCAECKQAWVRLQKAAELIDRGFNQAPPPYLRSKVIAQLKDRKQAKPSWLFWGVPGLIGAAALLLVIKIEPGRMAKQQAMETAPMEQAAPATLPTVKSAKPPRVYARKAEKEKRPAAPARSSSAPTLMDEDRLEVKSEAEPQEEVQLSRAPKKARAKADEASPAAAQEAAKAMAPLNHQNDDSGAWGRKSSTRVGREAGAVSASARETSGFLGAPAGGMAGERVSRSDAAAFAPAEAPAGDERRASASAAFRNEKDFTQARALSCALTPADIQGQLDPGRVKSGIAALSQAVTARIASQGEARVADLRVTIAADGNIQSAAFSGQAFASESLNRFILSQVNLQNFGQPLDSAPAAFTIKIDVR